MAEDEPEGFPPDWTPEDVAACIREIIRLTKEHAAELKAKGLDVDGTIAGLERELVELERAHARKRALEAALRREEETSAVRRRDLDRTVLGVLPPDLVDGGSTLAYLMEKAEERVRRRKRPPKRVGG